MGRGSAAVALADRFCRPHRIGLFGHRGVGKTTLLTMLYRAAVGGRLPDLRMAAADVPTAEYLSDKMVQLEAGETLPATLAETPLRLHLYYQRSRLDLVLRDYQGEHVELGRQGTIRDFLRDCDGVWLCLDLATMPESAARLRRQQEIEQLVEDYLQCETRPTLERPMALLLTKADLLPQLPDNLDELAQTNFGMTRHALQSHCAQSGLFAVSSLGDLLKNTQTVDRASRERQRPEDDIQERPEERNTPVAHAPGSPVPDWDQRLAAPLAWLCTSLRALDESRLERLWSLAGNKVSLLDRCVACFARRYPDAPATAVFQHRLRALRHRRRRRLLVTGLTAAACLLVGTWTYDAVGYQHAQRFAADHPEAPALVRDNWTTFATWHPTRQLSQTVTAEQEEQRGNDLIRQLRDQDRDERLAALRRHAVDPDADPATAWERFQEFRTVHPEVNVDDDLHKLRSAIKARRDEQVAERARRALDELQRAAQRSDDLPALVKQADAILAEYPGTPYEAEVRRCRTAFLRRLDEQDIQTARAYSARHPLNFQTRREHYQRYLDRHPTGGAFTTESETALRSIAADWDKHDFRAVRDHYVKDPGNVTGLVAHCRRYLAVHPQGKFKSSAADLLRWSERVSAAGEYRVVLRNGQFEKGVARYFSRGPKLSVELEVNGVRYGPSTIVYNRYDPEWDFEFPRRVRWKLGDSVVIRVTEHTWSDRVVAEFASDGKDPLALKMLNGEVSSGENRLKLECDFTVPVLPKIE